MECGKIWSRLRWRRFPPKRMRSTKSQLPLKTLKGMSLRCLKARWIAVTESWNHKVADSIVDDISAPGADTLELAQSVSALTQNIFRCRAAENVLVEPLPLAPMKRLRFRNRPHWLPFLCAPRAQKLQVFDERILLFVRGRTNTGSERRRRSCSPGRG